MIKWIISHTRWGLSQQRLMQLICRVTGTEVLRKGEEIGQQSYHFFFAICILKCPGWGYVMSDCHYHTTVRLSTFYFVDVSPVWTQICSLPPLILHFCPPVFGKQNHCKLKTKRLEKHTRIHLVSFHLDLALALALTWLDFARPCAVWQFSYFPGKGLAAGLRSAG